MDISISTEVKNLDIHVLSALLLEYSSQCAQVDDSPDKKTHSGYYHPFIGDLCEEVHREIHFDEKANLIQEAMDRRDDDLYGFQTRGDFFSAAWAGHIQDDSLEPKVTFESVQSKIIDLLLDHQIFFIDYHNVLRNTPIKEVW